MSFKETTFDIGDVDGFVGQQGKITLPIDFKSCSPDGNCKIFVLLKLLMGKMAI
jgi:hypothetical protein